MPAQAQCRPRCDFVLVELNAIGLQRSGRRRRHCLPQRTLGIVAVLLLLFCLFLVLFVDRVQLQWISRDYLEIGAALRAGNDFALVHLVFLDVEIGFTLRTENHKCLPPISDSPCVSFRSYSRSASSPTGACEPSVTPSKWVGYSASRHTAAFCESPLLASDDARPEPVARNLPPTGAPYFDSLCAVLPASRSRA